MSLNVVTEQALYISRNVNVDLSQDSVSQSKVFSKSKIIPMDVKSAIDGKKDSPTNTRTETIAEFIKSMVKNKNQTSKGYRTW